MARSATKHSTPRLSEVARHVVYPVGIVSSGYAPVAAKLAEVGVVFDPWQAGVGQLALAKRADGKYAATVGGVVLSIPRQVGKTYLVGMIVVALCLLHPNLLVIWTAHHLRTSTQTFEFMQAIVKRPGIRRHLADTANEGIGRSHGEQQIAFRNGSVIMFGARAQGFGRGFPQVDVEVFDEAGILGPRALEDMVPAVNQSKHPAGGLLFFMGTPPRPTDPGEHFTALRTAALSGETDADGRCVGARVTDMVYVETSADEDADLDDEAQWAKANPSYPVRTPRDSMLRMRAQLTDDDSFRREALGIWSTIRGRRVIDAESWGTIADPTSMAVDRLTLAVDVAPDRSVASVALAGVRPDGLYHVELDEQRTGTGWVTPWIVRRCASNDIRAVVIDGLSPASSLLEVRQNGRTYLKDAPKGVNIEVTTTTAREMANACGQFYDGVMDATFVHTDQMQVNVALSVAGKRPLVDAWAWNRKTATSDITPLVAETLALWGARLAKPKRAGSGRARSATSRKAVVL